MPGRQAKILYRGATAKEHLEWINDQLKPPIAPALEGEWTRHVILAMKEMATRLVALDGMENEPEPIILTVAQHYMLKRVVEAREEGFPAGPNTESLNKLEKFKLVERRGDPWSESHTVKNRGSWDEERQEYRKKEHTSRRWKVKWFPTQLGQDVVDKKVWVRQVR